MEEETCCPGLSLCPSGVAMTQVGARLHVGAVGGCFGHSFILGCSAFFQSQASVEVVFLIEMRHGPTVFQRTATTTTAFAWDG